MSRDDGLKEVESQQKVFMKLQIVMEFCRFLSWKPWKSQEFSWGVVHWSPWTCRYRIFEVFNRVDICHESQGSHVKLEYFGSVLKIIMKKSQKILDIYAWSKSQLLSVPMIAVPISAVWQFSWNLFVKFVRWWCTVFIVHNSDL